MGFSGHVTRRTRGSTKSTLNAGGMIKTDQVAAPVDPLAEKVRQGLLTRASNPAGIRDIRGEYPGTQSRFREGRISCCRHKLLLGLILGGLSDSFGPGGPANRGSVVQHLLNSTDGLRAALAPFFQIVVDCYRDRAASARSAGGTEEAGDQPVRGIFGPIDHSPPPNTRSRCPSLAQSVFPDSIRSRAIDQTFKTRSACNRLYGRYAQE